MIKLKIIKYKKNSDEPFKTVSVPLAVLKIFKNLIPNKVKEELNKEGIDIPEIIKLADSTEINGTILEVEDHEKDERVVISIES